MQDESISVFDIFKIGVGPSSSHTLGPWKAALQFGQFLQQEQLLNILSHVQVHLYGSLAKTGHGHGTDIAITLGLRGEDPVVFDTTLIESVIQQTKLKNELTIIGIKNIPFSFQKDIVFHLTESLPFHPNALTFQAYFTNGKAISQTYYSIGGGFVIQEGQNHSETEQKSLSYPVRNASDLLTSCDETQRNVSQVVMANELAWQPESAVRSKVLNIFKVMCEVVYRGCHTGGTLPGVLHVTRRASGLNQSLIKGNDYDNFQSWLDAVKKSDSDFKDVLSWVSCWALAVNEENAAFGRVVTAPTNGSAGVIPSVLLYNLVFNGKSSEDDIISFLLTASQIGAIFKKGATISAAMGGCQAEIGVSSAMAAAGLTESMGGSPRQVLMAAEIAMEHHLGLTCDPIAGLVQIPCIERNAMGAIKAITAAQLAMNSNPLKAKVSLDGIVKTMWQTAQDMDSKYKETSDGGLATNIPISLAEC